MVLGQRYSICSTPTCQRIAGIGLGSMHSGWGERLLFGFKSLAFSVCFLQFRKYFLQCINNKMYEMAVASTTINPFTPDRDQSPGLLRTSRLASGLIAPSQLSNSGKFCSSYGEIITCFNLNQLAGNICLIRNFKLSIK